MFPVRSELNFYILFRRNQAFKVLVAIYTRKLGRESVKFELRTCDPHYYIILQMSGCEPVSRTSLKKTRSLPC
jgi:hypothetical protein